MVLNPQDQYLEEILKRFRSYQEGMSFSIPSYGLAGEKVFLVQNFHIPMESAPTINFSNLDMINCSNPILHRKNKYGFIGYCTRIANGLAYFSLNWEALL